MKPILTFSLFLISITSSAQLFFTTYGGINDDRANYIQEDSFGNFILCGDSGRTSNVSYDSQGLLLKYDANGNLLWAKTYGDTTGQRFRSVKPTLDGGFLLHGDEESWLSGTMSLLMKTDSVGDSLWSTNDFGTMDSRQGIGIIPLADTTYIIASRNDDIQFFNPFQLTKIDSIGNELWANRTDVIYNSSVPYSNACMIHTVDNNIAVAGTNFIGGTGDLEIIVSKIDTQGVIVWFKQYGSAGVDWNALSISQTSDSGYIVSGSVTDPTTGVFDMLLMRLDMNGDSVWSKHYGGSGTDYFTAAEQTFDGGFVAFGYSNSYSNNYDAIILRVDANGDSIWQQSYGGMYDEIVTHGIICHDHGFAITGGTRSYGAGNQDAFILRTDSSGNVITNTKEISNTTVNIYPNPFKDVIHIRANNHIRKITISDLSGRVVSEVKNCENEMTILLPLNAGIYFLSVEYGSGQFKVEKIVCIGK